MLDWFKSYHILMYGLHGKCFLQRGYIVKFLDGSTDKATGPFFLFNTTTLQMGERWFPSYVIRHASAVPGLTQGCAQGQPWQDVSTSLRVIDSLLAHDTIRKTAGRWRWLSSNCLVTLSNPWLHIMSKHVCQWGKRDLRLIGDDLLLLFTQWMKSPIGSAYGASGSLHLLPCGQILRIGGCRVGLWRQCVWWRNCTHDSTMLDISGTRKGWRRGHWPSPSAHQHFFFFTRPGP